MISFTDFLLEKSNLSSTRLLTENVDEDVYWLNLSFFSYLYLIQHKKFSEELNQGKPLSFISSGTTSSEKSKFENVFDYPVTLYFNKKELLSYLDLLDKDKSEESTEDTPDEETPIDVGETTVDTSEEVEEIPTDLTIPINNFTFDISKNKDMLTKVEINLRPITEMRLDKDFKDFIKMFRQTLRKSMDDNIRIIKDEITSRSNNWISESKTSIELIFSE